MKTLKTQFVSIALTILAGLAFTGCEEQEELVPGKPGLLVPRTVDQDASLPQLSINGTNLHLETFGNQNDPLMVVLHGGPGGDYRSMLKCKAFANHGYFVIFYDQRGSGLSQRHRKNSYHADVMTDDLAAIIQHFRKSPDQKVFLLGHSWGAMLATALIDRYPTSIDGAILSEPGGFTWEVAKDYISRTRKGKPLSEGMSDALYYDQILTGKQNDHETLDYKFALMTVHDNAKGNVIGNAGATPFWRSGAVVQAAMFKLAEDAPFDYTRNLGQFTKRVLFMYSDLNTAYGPAHAQMVSSAYPNVQLTRINGTGHEIPWFGWEEYYPTVLEYLNAIK